MNNENGKFARTTEYIAITGGALSGISLILISYLNQNWTSELVDRIIYLISILVCALFILLQPTIKVFYPTRLKIEISYLLFCIPLLIGLKGIENHNPGKANDLSRQIWLGFGTWILIFALLIFVVGIWYEKYRYEKYRFALSILAKITATYLTLLTVLVFYQDQFSIIDNYTSSYVLNEFFAPVAGNFAYVNYIPQYCSSYSILLWPILRVLKSPENMISILSLLSILTIALLVKFGAKVLKQQSLITSAVLILPLIVLAPFPHREGYFGTIAALLSAYPIRILSGLLIIYTTLLFIDMRKKRTRTYRLLASSAICGFFVFGNLDFGLAAWASTLPILWLTRKLWADSRSVTIYLTGFLFGITCYPLTLISFGKSFDFKTIAYFPIHFSAGFGSEIIRFPGPAALVFGLISFATIYNLRSLRLAITMNDLGEIIRLSIGSIFSIWSLFGLNYFVNRSYASGQLQIIFGPMAVGLLTVLGSLTQTRKDSQRNKLSLFPAYLIIAALLSPILASSSPIGELRRLTQKNPNFPQELTRQAISNLQALDSAGKVDSVFIGSLGNYVQLKTGIKSGLVFNNPDDQSLRGAMEKECSYLKALNPKRVYADLYEYNYVQSRVANVICEKWTMVAKSSKYTGIYLYTRS